VTHVVIDPGHGGDRAAGGSTPIGARGRFACEKELALDVARRIRDRAPRAIALTRDDDRNLPLAGRIAIARELGATAFVSLHAGGASAGPEAWIHAHASVTSRQLGGRIASALASATGEPPSLMQGPLAVLDPDRHAAACASCLVELGRLGHPGDEARLLDPRHRDRLAEAITRTVVAERAPSGRTIVRDTRREQFDVWHEVPLVQQLTGMSCWAAAAAMIVGWRDCIDIDAEDVARGAGRWHAYRQGLEPADVGAFARAWGLEVARLSALSVAEIRRLISEHGPLWVGEASPGLHVVVVAGMFGDGSPTNSFVRIADPWPIGRGERYTISFQEFRESLAAAATLAGGAPQILHALKGTGRRHLAGVG
jgi:hypothetical protein